MPAHAKSQTIIDVPVALEVIDLGNVGTPISAQRRNLAIDIPGDTPDARAVMELNADGPGPEFNWTIYTIRNASPQERKVVLVADEQRFAASGLFRLVPFGQKPDGLVLSNGQDTLEREITHSGVAAAFTIRPNTTLTFAFEGQATVNTASLFSPEAFAAREQQLTFLRGASLAISFLLAFAMVALYGIRAHTAFIAGSLFAITAFGFLALESGYLVPAMQSVFNRQVDANQIRALVESALLFGLAICVSSFNALRQRGLLANLAVLAILMLCLANFVDGMFHPHRSTATARLGFVVLSALGLALGVMVRKSGFGVVRQGILLWSALASWTVIAAVFAVSGKPDMVQHAIIVTGLAAVLAVMTFTLTSFAFAQGFLAKPFVTDASRRSLALAGAQHHVWDWQPYDDRLEIGSDLATALGYDAAAWSTAPAEAFRSILHPEDEQSYDALLQPVTLRPGSFHELELRLRDVRGEFQWYALRVRALPGANQRTARCIGTLTDITRAKVVEDRLITDAVHDPVTGLPSRALFYDRLNNELGKPLSPPLRVVLVGLERFKNLNDGLGHDLGDQLLNVAGRRISDCLKPEETAARLSGGQFAVMFIETIDGRDVGQLAGEILATLAVPVNLGERSVHLAAAIGISHVSSDGYSAAEMQDQAAAALHEAQKDGQHPIRYFEAGHGDERMLRIDTETELRQALNNSELEVYYQPIVSLETRMVAGLEALVRWRHPRQGLLSPAKFLPVAEQAGLLPQIGSHVMAEALRQMGIWQRTLTRERPVYVAVNMSADELTDPTFTDRLRFLIAREGIRPNTVKIEITESIAMRHPDRARQLVQRLQGMGVGVSCDDFGTGFSSLSSLRDLPFDTVKIDRSFLVPEAMEGRGGVILDSVVALAHGLGMLVVAEGIEGETQAARLQAMGCDLGQGFFYGEAVSPREVEDLLRVLPPAHVVQQQAELDADVYPQPGAAPMAPRLRNHEVPLEDEPLFEDEVDDTDTQMDVEPEILPSIFSVNKEFVPEAESNTPKSRKVTPRMAKSKSKPKAKAKGKAPAKRKAPTANPSRARKPRS